MARIGDMNNRHERILNILANEAAASVTGLSDILGASKETIRKDLQVLAEQGKVTRIHGGAALLDSSVNMPFTIRQNVAEMEKRHVAECACQLIQENASLIIEGSTTSLALCEALLRAPEKLATLSLITNSIKIAQMLGLGAKCRKLFLLGGRTDAEEGVSRGKFVLSMLREFHADMAFISAAAMNQQMQIMAFREDDMLFQRQAIASASRTYVLMNASKFPSSALYSVCRCQEIDGLVTDAVLDEKNRMDLLEAHTVYMQAT